MDRDRDRGRDRDRDRGRERDRERARHGGRDRDRDRARDLSAHGRGVGDQHSDDGEWNIHAFGLNESDTSTLFERPHPTYGSHRRARASVVYDANGVPIDEDGNYIDTDGMLTLL